MCQVRSIRVADFAQDTAGSEAAAPFNRLPARVRSADLARSNIIYYITEEDPPSFENNTILQ